MTRVDSVDGEHADAGFDDYAERVLRNEGRLLGLEVLVAETRTADGKLIEQRAESLAHELERRATHIEDLVKTRSEALLALSKEERASDQLTVQAWIARHAEITTELRDGIRREGEITLSLLREVYDTALRDMKMQIHEGLGVNHTQSQNAIHELELRQQAHISKLEALINQRRESDREARELFAQETNRHLEQLNHNNERMAAFQANSVTRELWQSEKDASINREGLIREQIISVEKTMLGMTPIASSEKAHAELRTSFERQLASTIEALNTKIGVVDDKVSDLKTSRDTNSGKSQGYTAFYGWAVAALGLMITVVVSANALFGGGS